MIPVSAVDYWLNSEGLVAFDGNGFQWQSCITFALAIILLPIAFSSAQKQTGYFKISKETEPLGTQSLS